MEELLDQSSSDTALTALAVQGKRDLCGEQNDIMAAILKTRAFTLQCVPCLKERNRMNQTCSTSSKHARALTDQCDVCDVSMWEVLTLMMESLNLICSL